MRRRARRLALLVAATSLLASLALVLWQVKPLAGGSLTDILTGSTLVDYLADSRPGRLWLVRWGAIAALGLLVALAGRRTLAAGVVILVPALLIGQALAGHAAAVGDDAAVVSQAVHLAAAGLWVGGLLALILAAGAPTWAASPGERSASVTAWRRFGFLAGASVPVLIVTGLYSSGRQVATPDALISTLYGKALLAKVAVVALVAALGLANALILRTRVRSRIGARRSRFLMAEAAIGVAVLLLVGVMTSTAPARGPRWEAGETSTPQSFLSQPIDDLLVTLSVRPNKPGENIVEVGATSTRRPPPAEVESVTATISSPALEQDSVTLELAPGAVGTYRADGSHFSLSGPWQVSVTASRPGLADAVASFDWEVPAAARYDREPVKLSDRPLRGALTAAAAVVAVLTLAAAAGFWIAARRPWEKQDARRRVNAARRKTVERTL